MKNCLPLLSLLALCAPLEPSYAAAPGYGVGPVPRARTADRAAQADRAIRAVTADTALAWSADEVTPAVSWTVHSAAASSYYGVTYGAGVFVVVAYAGTPRVITSTDGIVWTTRTPAEVNGWTDVAYGASVFCAVAFDGAHRVMSSSDAITWAARSATAANSWISVAYGAALFVAVSSEGTIMSSPDCVTWTARTVDAGLSFSTVTRVNDRFIASGYSGKYAYSTDGITWTAHDFPEANSFYEVAYGNGVYVAVAYDGTHRIFSSVDALTWTAETAPVLGYSGLLFTDGVFLALAGPGSAHGAAVSSDGKTWWRSDPPFDDKWLSGAVGNGSIVVIGTSSTATARIQRMVPVTVGGQAKRIQFYPAAAQ